MSDQALDFCVFEQPLNERIRACLRLEHLFARINHHLERQSPLDSLNVILLLIEAADVLSRIDIKRELIKEIERQQNQLMAVADSPGVDSAKLKNLLAEQERLIRALYDNASQPGAHLKNNELLNAIRQRASIPGALCEFDIPGLHYWMGQSFEQRQADIQHWLAPFTDIRTANEMVIGLIRDSVDPIWVTAREGFLQQSIDYGAPFQLLRLILEPGTPGYPEISAGKHRFSVRFMSHDMQESLPKQISQDIEFRLALCRL